jgi:tetratricopeptide (TPR) repeat protein
VTRTLPVLLIAVGLAAGCAGLRPPPLARVEPVRLSELASQGDPARRASQRLLLRGLEEEDAGRPALAQGQYERALQVDPTNPWVYLALARHELAAGTAARALPFLDQAESLLGREPGDPRRVEPHLLGLRGAALVRSGRAAEGAPLLDRAAALAPGVWADGRLDASELR